MRILISSDFDPVRSGSACDHLCAALARDDLASAGLTRIPIRSAAPAYFRARLPDGDAVLLCLLACRGEICALLLEHVPADDFTASRYLRREELPYALITDGEPVTTLAGAGLEDALLPLPGPLRADRQDVHVFDQVLAFDAAQQAALDAPDTTPIAGPPGSGRSVLALAWLRRKHGRLLYLPPGRGQAREALRRYFAYGDAGLGEVDFLDSACLPADTTPMQAPRYDAILVDDAEQFTATELEALRRWLRPEGVLRCCGNPAALPEHGGHPLRSPATILDGAYRGEPAISRWARRIAMDLHTPDGLVPAAPQQVCLLDEARTPGWAMQLRAHPAVAVLVRHAADKAAARRACATPLVFTLDEAADLQFDEILLYHWLTDAPEALAHPGLANDLLRAATCARRRLLWVEPDGARCAKLGLNPADVAASLHPPATADDWTACAHSLAWHDCHAPWQEIQALPARRVPPWQVLDAAGLRALLAQARQALPPEAVQRLLQYAACHDEAALVHMLVERGAVSAPRFEAQRESLRRKALAAYYQQDFREILRHCELYGVDHRLPLGGTPLMAAAAAGNLPLVEALLARGAWPYARDQYGYMAMHWVLRVAFRDRAYARGPCAALLARVSPPWLDLMADGEPLRLNSGQPWWWVMHSMYLLFRGHFNDPARARPQAGFEVAELLQAWQTLPATILPASLHKPRSLAALLSRLSKDADQPSLLERPAPGRYGLRPELRIVIDAPGGATTEQALLECLNLSLLADLATPASYRPLQELAARAQVRIGDIPLLYDQGGHDLFGDGNAALKTAEAPAWGTPQARALALAGVPKPVKRTRDARAPQHQQGLLGVGEPGQQAADALGDEAHGDGGEQ